MRNSSGLALNPRLGEVALSFHLLIPHVQADSTGNEHDEKEEERKLPSTHTRGHGDDALADLAVQHLLY